VLHALGRLGLTCGCRWLASARFMRATRLDGTPAASVTSWILALLQRMDTNDQPIIRHAALDDLGALLQVYDEARIAGPTVQENETWLAMLATDTLTVYCAQVGVQLVGTAALMVMPNLRYGCRPTAFIEAVAVRTQWRRQGIATAMLRRVLEDARSLGCNKVQLLSHKRHATDGAYGLYEKLGFDAEAEGFRQYLGTVPAAVIAARNERTAPDR